MKYIRTEDGIYEVVDETKYSYISIYGKYIKKDDVIEDGDTIEELCDEFVLVERNSKPRIFTTLKGAINNKIYDDEDIYGAIWTNKGLIYVAKMNDKGELALI